MPLSCPHPHHFQRVLQNQTRYAGLLVGLVEVQAWVPVELVAAHAEHDVERAPPEATDADAIALLVGWSLAAWSAPRVHAL